MELVEYSRENCRAHIYIIIDGYKSNMFASETRFWINEKLYNYTTYCGYCLENLH